MKTNKRNILLLASLGYVLAGAAQSHVTGIVTDAATHSPVPGVMISSGPYQAISEADGRYTIKTASDKSTLQLKLSGYADRTVSLRGDTLLNIKIYSNAFRSAMSSDVFSTATTELSLDDVLAQREGGSIRSVSRGGLAAMGSNMFIRGLNTLNSNAQPLVVVDGTVWDNETMSSSLFSGHSQNPLADIDVNDIENVQIMKDASSIYGSKGANGAILITTKRSHSSVTRINVDLSYGFNFRPKTYDMMNSADFRTYLSEVMKGSEQASDLATGYKTWLGSDPTTAEYSTYHNNTDWTDEVYHTGNTQHYGISIDGSDDIASYAITLGYTTNDATVKSVDFSRLNARINGDIILLKNLNVGLQLMYSYLTRNLQDDGTVENTSPTFLSAVKSPFLAPYSYTDDGSMLTSSLNDVDVLGVSNPLAITENAKNSNKHYRFGLSIAPVWKINSSLTLDGRFSYQLINTKEHYFTPMKGVSPQEVDGNIWLNTVKDQSVSQNSIYGDINLKYAHDFGRSHVEAGVGARTIHTELKTSYVDGHNTGNDDVTNMNNALSFRTLGGVNTDWSNLALLAHASYTYDNRYTLWGALTEESSSRFGANADDGFRMMGGTWGTFPSVGAEWNLGNESFMSGVRAVSNAKLHVSYGITGNDDINGMNRYSYLDGVSYLGNATGLQIGGLSNEKLKWETTGKFNAGIDVALLNDRVTIGFDYFSHTTSDLLNYRRADITSGKDYYLYNSGKLKNTGFEINLGGRPVVLKNFSWMTNIAVQHYKNEITELPTGNYTTDILGGQVLTAEGQSAAVFYGYKSNGVYSTQAEAVAANLKVQNDDASYSTFSAGDIRFTDVDHNGVINDDDKQVIGNPNPDFTGSFFNRFTYNRLSLEVLCTFSSGNDVYNYQRQLLEGMTNTWNQTNAIRNRWKTEGQQTDIPKSSYGDPMGNSRFSDRWIEDGSYFKIKNVKLSYTIPITNTYIQGLMVWVAAENLATFTHYLGVDPEVSMNGNVLYQGIDNGLLAAGRSFHMGIKINL